MSHTLSPGDSYKSFMSSCFKTSGFMYYAFELLIAYSKYPRSIYLYTDLAYSCSFGLRISIKTYIKSPYPINKNFLMAFKCIFN